MPNITYLQQLGSGDQQRVNSLGTSYGMISGNSGILIGPECSITSNALTVPDLQIKFEGLVYFITGANYTTTSVLNGYASAPDTHSGGYNVYIHPKLAATGSELLDATTPLEVKIASFAFATYPTGTSTYNIANATGPAGVLATLPGSYPAIQYDSFNTANPIPEANVFTSDAVNGTRRIRYYSRDILLCKIYLNASGQTVVVDNNARQVTI